jgi:hypothetical protein
MTGTRSKNPRCNTEQSLRVNPLDGHELALSDNTKPEDLINFIDLDGRNHEHEFLVDYTPRRVLGVGSVEVTDHDAFELGKRNSELRSNPRVLLGIW